MGTIFILFNIFCLYLSTVCRNYAAGDDNNMFNSYNFGYCSVLEYVSVKDGRRGRKEKRSMYDRISGYGVKIIIINWFWNGIERSMEADCVRKRWGII